MMAKKNLSPEEVQRLRARRNAYMRNYMAERKAVGTISSSAVDSGRMEPPFALKTAQALYLPGRDAPLRHESLTAELMGDPPIGRRAVDKAPGER